MAARCQSLIPEGPNYCKAAWDEGLRNAGFRIHPRINNPEPGDVLLTWNRSGGRNAEAQRFERAGATILVGENGLCGKLWRGQKWFSLARGHHSGAGDWRPAGPERWDSWGVELAPWCARGETLILAQRGIGEPGIASPPDWAQQVQARIGGRIRPHPGPHEPAVPLAEDLATVGRVVTWHSSAALLALMAGVPVYYRFPQWIGAGAALPLSAWESEPKRDDAARLEMFRRAAWSHWTVEEIATGEPIARLLGR